MSISSARHLPTDGRARSSTSTTKATASGSISSDLHFRSLHAWKGAPAMTHDHRSIAIHQADLDREIETIRTEHVLAASHPRDGRTGRARRATGRLLIAAGLALVGREPAMRTHRA